MRGRTFIARYRRPFIVAASAAVVLFAAGFLRAGSGPTSEAAPRTVAGATRERTAPPQTSVGNPPKSPGNNTATVAALPAKASSPAPPPVISADVVHLHRLGSCHGRLAVTPDGVSFVTKENDGDDSFTLKYPEFLHALEGDALILKTGTKTYRFKAEESRSRNGARLRDVANRIARARR